MSIKHLNKIYQHNHLKFELLLKNFYKSYHQFQIEFDSLSDELFEKLSKIPHVKNPSRVGHSLHFYGRERKVFFEVLSEAASSTMKDIRIKKLGLQDLMDAKYAKDGIH